MALSMLSCFRSLRTIRKTTSYISYKYRYQKLREICRHRVRLYGTVRSPPDDKIHINVGTIGHIDHGKTTLTSAITRVLSESGKNRFVSYEDIDRAPEERLRGITINVAHLEYSTAKRHYAHTDCPGHADFIKNMICGTSQMDGAVVVVAADDGSMPQTREHLLVSRQLGVEKMVVYINKADLVQPDVVELVELEMRELLNDFGFDGDGAPVIVGSALLAMKGEKSEMGTQSVEKLLDAMDSYIEPPKRDVTGPLLAPLEGGVSIPGRGTVIIGTILRGTLNRGDKVEIVGFNKKIPTVATEIQAFGKSKQSCQAGDHVGILVRGVKMNVIERGMSLIKPGSGAMHNRYKAQLYLLAKGEGGRSKPIASCYIMPLFSRTWNLGCRVDVCDGGMIMPGEHGNVNLTLAKKMFMQPGQSFTIRELKRTVATGIIAETLPDVEIQDNLGKIQLSN